VDDLRDLLERSSTIEQRSFLKSFVERIEVDDSEIKIYYTIPMPPSSMPEERDKKRVIERLRLSNQ